MKTVKRERFIPAGSTEVKTADGVMYLYDTVGKLCNFAVLVYGGRRSKADRHEAYQTESHRQVFVDSVIRSHAKRVARRAKEKACVNPFNVGDILSCSWGYDQTNVDFYQVLAVTAKGLTMQEIEAEAVQGSGKGNFMSDSCVPVKDKFVGEPMRKRVGFYDNSAYVTVNGYKSASLWNGEPQRRSFYA